MNIVVTGGAGFIGSALVRYLVGNTSHQILNIDKLTYAGHLESLEPVSNESNYTFAKMDICDANLANLIREFRPDAVMHLAAESHVDRSINSSEAFIQSNIVGTYNLLEACRVYWLSLPESDREAFRFLHVSTDEVYGELGREGLFNESSPYKPNSPYSASKASSDHLVRAWFSTYGLPVLITNCSNNFGPFQFPEKLIPKLILNALQGKGLPVYGKGAQVRDWLYVEDHVNALYDVLLKGRVGQTYNIGAHQERQNIEVVRQVCLILDELVIDKPGAIESFLELIEFVEDRPGHDFRYAIDASKLRNELNWKPEQNFKDGLRETVEWYLKNEAWCNKVVSKKTMVTP